jgi:broad specificity phosphatase PhoE
MSDPSQKFKRIYFVRHGESTNNIKRKDGQIDLSIDSELTNEGIKQAEKLALRFNNIQIDRFFSSPYIRARQTADKIKDVIKKDYEILEEAKERSSSNSSDQLDRVYSLKIEGSESFESIIKRCEELKRKISICDEENILIVSHGMFLRIFAAYVVFGDELTTEIAETFMKKFMTKNTGIFKFYMFDDNWRIGTWNDDYHI